MVQLLAGCDEVKGKGQFGEEGERGAMFLELFVERREFAVSHLQPSQLLLRYTTVVLHIHTVEHLKRAL